MENTSVFVPSEIASIAIQQMQLFGWTLVGQESTIHREEPCHELSFVRALDVPYLDRIRELEDQYPFGELPNIPVSTRIGGNVRTLLACVGFIFLAFSFVGTLMHLGNPVFSLGLNIPIGFLSKQCFGGLLMG